MDEEKLKQAFAKVKQDIDIIKSEIQELKRTLDKQKDTSTDKQTHNQTENTRNTAIQQLNSTENPIPAHFPADNLSFKALKSPNSSISIGNEGVPADRQQTDKQTDTSTRNKGVKFALIKEDNIKEASKENKINKLEKVVDFISSLDDIKKDLRAKIKRLTKQEMSVFTAIYNLEEQGFIIDYQLLAEKLSLTESSIRDYIQRLIKKDIPIEKSKENNKKIILSISQNLKKIASLSTIIHLRER